MPQQGHAQEGHGLLPAAGHPGQDAADGLVVDAAGVVGPEHGDGPLLLPQAQEDVRHLDAEAGLTDRGVAVLVQQAAGVAQEVQGPAEGGLPLALDALHVEELGRRVDHGEAVGVLLQGHLGLPGALVIALLPAGGVDARPGLLAATVPQAEAQQGVHREVEEVCQLQQGLQLRHGLAQLPLAHRRHADAHGLRQLLLGQSPLPAAEAETVGKFMFHGKRPPLFLMGLLSHDFPGCGRHQW